MKSFERISAILSSFNSAEASQRIDALLERTHIPPSSGYKIISDLIAEGLLSRTGRGVVKLGPYSTRLLYAPLRANRSTGNALLASSPKSAIAPRKAYLEGVLLKLIDTKPYKKEPPYTLGFANASRAHPWRRALEQSLIAASQRQSHVVSRMVVYDAQNDPARQIAHLKQMRDESVDLCIVSAVNESHEGLSKAIAETAAVGIPIVGVDRACGDVSNLVSFVTASDETVGRVSALWLAEHLKGSGEIVMLCGMRGASPCTIRLQAALATLEKFPDIRITAIEYTDWLAERGYDVMENHLSHNRVPDGVWCDSGLQGIGSLKAFCDKGFKRGEIPAHTGGEMNLMYKMAVTEKVPLCGLDYPAAMGSISFQTGLDILAGRQVPCLIEADLQIIVTRGHETASVRADLHAERKVDWHAADSLVHAAGRARSPRSEPKDSKRRAEPSTGIAVSKSYTDSSRRLVDIMTLVAERPIVTAYETARALNMPLSSTYEAINELERLSWLIRSEDGHLLVGKVPQQIGLTAQCINIDAHRLLAVVRYLRDQTGETSFAGILGADLQIGPWLVGFNYNCVRFTPFKTFAMELRRSTVLTDEPFKTQSRPEADMIGASSQTSFVMIPIRRSSASGVNTELVIGLGRQSGSIDEERAFAHLREVQELLYSETQFSI